MAVSAFYPLKKLSGNRFKKMMSSLVTIKSFTRRRKWKCVVAVVTSGGCGDRWWLWVSVVVIETRLLVTIKGFTRQRKWECVVAVVTCGSCGDMWWLRLSVVVIDNKRVSRGGGNGSVWWLWLRLVAVVICGGCG